MRRTIIEGSITLGQGWASGGYLANSQVTDTIHFSSQQQWFNRNVSMKGQDGGAFNFVFLGCEGAPASNCGTENNGRPFTTIKETPIIAEKPFISINEDDGRYQLNIPHYQKNVSGHSFDAEKLWFVGFEEVYVTAVGDDADKIN